MKQVKYLPLCKRHRAKPSKQRRKPVARAAASLEEPVRAADGEVFNLRYWRNLLGHIEDVVMVSVLPFILLAVFFYPIALGAAGLILMAAAVFLWNYADEPFALIAKERETMHWLWKIQLPIAVFLAGLELGKFMSGSGPETEIAFGGLLICSVLGGLSFTRKTLPGKSVAYMMVSLLAICALLLSAILGIWQPPRIFLGCVLTAALGLHAVLYIFGCLRANCQNCVKYTENGFQLAPRVAL